MSFSPTPHSQPGPEEIRSVSETGCCIVGGGPAGMILSLLLARRGVPVTLLEMHKDFDREFRGDTIHPSSMEILDQIGLADKLLEIPHTQVSSLAIQFADGPFRPFDLKRLKTRFPYILLLPQVRFLEFLAAEAVKYREFKLIMHANVNQLVKDNGVAKGVRYLATDGLHEIRARLTIGADGRFSQVRRLAGIEPIKTSPPMDVLWFRFPRLAGEPNSETGAFGGLGKGRILILLARTDHWQGGLIFPKGHYQEMRAQGVEAVRKRIVEIDPRFAKHTETLTEWRQMTLLSVESSRCPIWHRPGLLLIGDAAHVMSPVGGLGINYAIQDAVVAANLLTDRLKSGQIAEADLAKVQHSREWPTRVIQRWQTVMQNLVLASAFKGQKVTRVPWALRLFSKTPILRDLPAKLVAFGIRRVRLKNP